VVDARWCRQSLVDDQGHDEIQAEAQKAKDAIAAGDWQAATDYWASTEWVVIDETHGVDFYNILKFVDYWSRQRRDVSEPLAGLKRQKKSRSVLFDMGGGVHPGFPGGIDVKKM
jgi:hypothetical protein